MKKINTKGLAQANKCMTMAAVAYNLKKLLRFTERKIQVNYMAKANLQRIVKNSFRTACLNVSSAIVVVKNHLHFSQSIRQMLTLTAN
ncbi:hypothetical protein [Pedobacter miscanthi]|uniref:hypothetical protein n=1 Tax=Pedobacter miscanthi TaxID=2259170 RepID=UPI00292FF29B|nr:hypothetical protein [Pedobacter miscanthi]